MSETKFTKGKWSIGSIHNLCVISERKINHVIAECSIDSNMSEKEQLANTKLIAYAPEMFYRTVLLANSEGWQEAFNLIEKVTGKKYTFNSNEFNVLVKEAKSYFLA